MRGNQQPVHERRRLADGGLFLAVLALCVLGLGVLLRVSLPDFSDFRPGPDESFYLSYARYLAEEPGASFRTLATEYITRPDWQVYPNPLRAGYVLLASWWMRATDHYDYRALVYMSSCFSIASLPLGYVFVRRAFGPKAALLSLILLAVSPLNLAMSRRALQDGVVYFFAVSTLYLFYEALRRDSRLAMLCFALSLLAAVLVKETSVLWAASLLLFLGMEKRLYHRDFSFFAFAFAITAPLVAALVVYSSITGGFEGLVTLATIILESPRANPFAIGFQSGPFFISYVVDFFLLSPLTLLGCVGFFLLSLREKGFRQEPHAYLMTFLVVTCTAFSFFSKNVRYVIPLDFPIRVLAALLVFRLSGGSGTSPGRFTASLVLASLVAATDLFMFRQLFVESGIYDPVTAELERAWRAFVRFPPLWGPAAT